MIVWAWVVSEGALHAAAAGPTPLAKCPAAAAAASSHTTHRHKNNNKTTDTEQRTAQVLDRLVQHQVEQLVVALEHARHYLCLGVVMMVGGMKRGLCEAAG